MLTISSYYVNGAKRTWPKSNGEILACGLLTRVIIKMDTFRVKQEEMDAIIRTIHCDNEAEVIENFRKEKIISSTVKYLTDEQLTQLGVPTIGERTQLKTLCSTSVSNERIMKEVQRVLKPTESEQPKLINRRSGKARKGSIAPKLSQSQSQTFQKKVVVLKYMGSKPPLQFNINDGLILTTGFLPEISYESTELEVRQIIVEVLHNDTAEDLSSVTTYDFQFVAVKGKKATILTCLPRNFEYSGRILKQTAGNGPVYIRLTASFIKQPRVSWSPLSSDSDFELPDASSIYNKKPKSSKIIIDVSDADSDFELPSTTTGTSMPALSSLLSSTSQGLRSTSLHHSTTKQPANTSQSSFSASVNNPSTCIPASSVSPPTLGGCCSTATSQPASQSTSSDYTLSAIPVSTDTPSTSGARLHTYGSLSLSSDSSNQHPVKITQSTSTSSVSANNTGSTCTPLTSERRRTYRSLSLRRPTSTRQPFNTFQSPNARNTLSAMPVSTDTPSNQSTQHLASLVEHSPRSVISTNHAPLSTSHAPLSLPVTSSHSLQISSSSNESPFNFDQELELLQYSPVKDVHVSPSLETLYEMFPNFMPDAIKMLYEIFDEDGALVSNCLVEGVPLHCLLQQLNLRFISVSIPEAPKIRIEGDDDWVDAAFTFYKGQSFRKDAPVRLLMADEPAIDAGGVSAQFYAEVYKRLAEGKKKIFEGDLDFVRPVFNLSLAGVLKVFGIMVAHSIIVQKVGFPYFSPSCYYFMLGHYEIAATKVLRKEVSGKVNYVLNEIESYEGDVYEELECFESLVELMDECGIIDIPIKRYNMARITQAILLFDTLQKRKLLLDMIGEGLDMHYGLRRLMSHFPTIFEPLFLYSGTLTSRDIINIIIPPECTSEKEYDLLDSLYSYLRKCDDKQLLAFLIFITGKRFTNCNSINVKFSDTLSAIKVDTCASTLYLSKRICKPKELENELNILLDHDLSYTTM